VPGRYTLSAQRDDGFVAGDYGAPEPNIPGPPLSLEPGQERRDLTFRLVPLGAISGIVVNQDGEPVRQVSVVFTSMGPYGDVRVTGTHNYWTNDRGEFRVYDLIPGKYVLLAVPPSVARGTPLTAAAEGKRATTVTLPTYYPSAPDVATAASVDLLPGRELSGIGITLREGPVFHVRGTLSGEGSPANLTLMLFPHDFPITTASETLDVLAQRFGNPRAVASDGTFDLANVEPGTYDLVAMGMNARGRTALGRAEVVVSDEDVKEVVLPLGKLVTLSVAVSVEGQEKADVSGGLMLWQLDNNLNLSQTASGPLDSAGHGQIDGILPGQYRADIRTRLQGVYVKSLHLRTALGGREVTQLALDLDDSVSGATLEVVLGADGGTVTGVLKIGDEPAPTRAMDLVPEVPNPERSPNWKAARSDDEGRFSFTGVAPGDYRLYAWEDSYASSAMRFDAAFRRRYRDGGVTVSVAAGGSTQVKAKVVQAK
jgi:hypothetical protein